MFCDGGARPPVQIDLLPVSWTVLRWRARVQWPGDGGGDEAIGVFQRRVTSLRAEAGGGRDEDRGGLQDGRDQRGDVLQLTQEVCRSNALGDDPKGGAANRLRELVEENAKRKRPVPDLCPDKAMLAGCRLAKALRPARLRLVDEVRTPWQARVRWAYSVLRAARSSCHDKGCRTEQADRKQRTREIAGDAGSIRLSPDPCAAAPDVVEVPERACAEIGFRGSILVDRGSAFSSASWTCGPA